MKKTNYIGMTQRKFKDRLTQHKHSFKNQSKRNATTLSTYTWDNQINTHLYNKMKLSVCLYVPKNTTRTVLK